MPAKTQKHPDGCPTCWGVWEHAKADLKHLVKTVNIELLPEEARQMVIILSRFAHTDPMLKKLFITLVQGVGRAT